MYKTLAHRLHFAQMVITDDDNRPLKTINLSIYFDVEWLFFVFGLWRYLVVFTGSLSRQFNNSAGVIVFFDLCVFFYLVVEDVRCLSEKLLTVTR